MKRSLSLFIAFPLFLGITALLEAKTTKTIKVTPHIRTLPLEEPGLLLSPKEIRALTEDHLFVDAKEFLEAPRISAIEDQRLLAAQNDRIYAPTLAKSKIKNFVICNKGAPLIHPKTKEKLGFSTHILAKAQLESDSRGTLRITEAKEPVMVGMRILPAPFKNAETVFEAGSTPLKDPTAASLEGLIISLQAVALEIGARDLVTVSLGRLEGMKTGQLLDVYSTPPEQKGCSSCRKKANKSPFSEYKKGQLFVLEAAEKLSLAQVIEAIEPIHLRDVVRTP